MPPLEAAQLIYQDCRKAMSPYKYLKVFGPSDFNLGGGSTSQPSQVRSVYQTRNSLWQSICETGVESKTPFDVSSIIYEYAKPNP